MSDLPTRPTAASKTRIDAASTEVRPDPVPESAFSSTPGGSGSRNYDPKTILTVRATPYGHAFALLVPKSVIPDHERNDVLEVRVSRRLDVKDVPLYTTHLPGYKRAYLDLFQLGAKLHEEFRIGEVARYSAQAFANGYNAAKPHGLDNTELVRNDKLWMRVDSVPVELKGAGFRTYQGQVMLDAELGDAGAIKIAKSLETFSVRLRDHSPVTSVKVNGSSVLLTYQRTDHDDHPHVRAATKGMVVSRSKRANPWAGKIEMVTRPEGTEGCYRIRVSESARNIVRARLAASYGLNAYKQEKGTIAEEMISYVLSLAGWREVVDHPADTSYKRTGSSRTGPDSLQERISTGLRYLFEYKWWSDTGAAYDLAVRQMKKLANSDTIRNLKGGCIGILDWDLGNVCANIHVETVWLRGE